MVDLPVIDFPPEILVYFFDSCKKQDEGERHDCCIRSDRTESHCLKNTDEQEENIGEAFKFLIEEHREERDDTVLGGGHTIR